MWVISQIVSAGNGCGRGGMQMAKTCTKSETVICKLVEPTWDKLLSELDADLRKHPLDANDFSQYSVNFRRGSEDFRADVVRVLREEDVE